MVFVFVVVWALILRTGEAFAPWTSTVDRHASAPSVGVTRSMAAISSPDRSAAEKYTEIPGLENVIRPSITDKARTVADVCTSGTLCTTSVQEGVMGSPFGSYVDYILDENGWPVLLLSKQSIHTVNLMANPQGMCLVPRTHS